jgi:hypothetical protein
MDCHRVHRDHAGEKQKSMKAEGEGGRGKGRRLPEGGKERKRGKQRGTEGDRGRQREWT